MLYDKKELQQKALKFYSSGKFFIAFMQNEQIFPYKIALKKLSQDMVRKNISSLHQEIRKIQDSKYEVLYKEFNFKSIGVQKLPIETVFHTQKSFLTFIDRAREFELFCDAYEKSQERFPALRELYLQKPNLLLQNAHIIDELLAIVEFFQNNPKPNIYIRELSILGVDTKFIEKNKVIVDAFLQKTLDSKAYDASITNLSKNLFEKKYSLKYELPTVRFRILDASLYIDGLSDITLTIEEFERLNIGCKRIFIVENKITTLCFSDIKDAIVIFGSGYKVSVLKNVKWMRDKEIFYWGDIDMDGFAILSQARGYFAQIKSLMMDTQTLEMFKNLSVNSQDRAYKKLQNLTLPESNLYEALYHDAYSKNIRLEQERIPFNYVLERFKYL